MSFRNYVHIILTFHEQLLLYFGKFIHASMHSVTSVHAFLAAYGNVFGNGRQRNVNNSLQVHKLGLFNNNLNYPHIVQPADHCTNAANIHPSAKRLPPYTNIYPPAHLMSSI
jgi:hypothetical protein